MEKSSMDIDESLYSRQRYMLGDQAMKKMMLSSVLLLGCDCLGVEIAKNLTLTGIGELEIADNSTVRNKDVLTNFYVTRDDMNNQVSRAAACVPRIKELNPYVNVSVSSLDTVLEQSMAQKADATNSLKESLRRFDCVICSQLTLDEQLLLNKLCRELGNVKFVSTNVYGLFSSVFCDFAENFQVYDPTGEYIKENFIGDITTSTVGLVTCLDNVYHGLETGALVMFKSLNGMSGLNQQIQEIKVVTPYSFTIGDTTTFSRYLSGGIFKEVTCSLTVSHDSLKTQLSNPTILPADFGKLENPLVTHAAFIALNEFAKENSRLPRAGETEDAEDLYNRYLSVIKENKFDVIDGTNAKNIVDVLSCTCRGSLSPLCAAVGGIVSQEVLKSITGKYTPLKQWVYVDAVELFDTSMKKSMLTTDLDSPNEICFGKKLINTLSTLNVFIVGCGAIGCEMLKNFALLGVSSGNAEGKLTITDNDTIEKSNLNRQFLFKSKHVGMSKSVVGGRVAKDINPSLNIESMQYKVGPDTQESIFPDSFFRSNDIIVNALDNVEARRFMDARCVSNQLPLIESGTMGPKGHVQVVVPFLTESYSSQSDPVDVQYPFCTLKSFPYRIEHTIQWARDKFETTFSQKPMMYNKFWNQCFIASGKDLLHTPSLETFMNYLQSGGSLDDAYSVLKILSSLPRSWSDCVHYARCKFEFFFNHKAKNLITSFPLDTKLPDGSTFWTSPKQPPSPIVFDRNDSLHMQFVVSLASLTAAVYNIRVPDSNEITQTIDSVLIRSTVPEFVPSKKEIITDEKSVPTKNIVDEDIDAGALKSRFHDMLESGATVPKSLSPQDFEKDDDSNHHIDFISATANLRALMYGIDMADRLEVKRIAGRIIPAISTTTSAVAGLATIQFLQLAKQIMKNRITCGQNWVECPPHEVEGKLSMFRNVFLNLALPVAIFSEPAAATRTAISSEISFTEWDRWEVKGNMNFKLSDLIEHIQKKVRVPVSVVLQGAKMVYASFMPGHRKKIRKPMSTLLKTSSTLLYVDLTIVFTNENDEEDLSCPRVRYYL